MCVWVELPPGFDANELLIHARERGVLLRPADISIFRIRSRIRCGSASRSLDEKQIARGIATLADVLRVEMRKRQRGARRAEARPRVALV